MSLLPSAKGSADLRRFLRVFRGYAERKRRKRENDSASVIQRNFRKHLRMVGSRRVKAQTFAERRERSFSRSWSDPTPMKADTSHDSRDSSDLQSSHCTLDEACEDLDWDTEKGLEATACDTEGFLPPKVMLISSKVPKAEYIPTIIRRDDPSIIPILYVSVFPSSAPIQTLGMPLPPRPPSQCLNALGDQQGL